MHCYKRNQVEEAIAAALAGAPPGTPPPTCACRIKRLLETDRALADDSRATNPPALSALYTGEAPGRGLEVVVLGLRGVRPAAWRSS